ncbi:MAG: PspC domain-containing protein [Bacteroidetes bacterium]|nr:PspC domain-containing protein [Bacteroidota bacterium]
MRKKVFLGVCYWLSQRFNLNVTGVRLVFFITFLLSLLRLRKFGFIVLIVYFILSLIKPGEKEGE